MADRNARSVKPLVTPEGKGKFVWRNKMTDGYKIGLSYKDIPLDLSNYLLIRTREYLLLQNKLSNKLFKPTFLS